MQKKFTRMDFTGKKWKIKKQNGIDGLYLGIFVRVSHTVNCFSDQALFQPRNEEAANKNKCNNTNTNVYYQQLFIQGEWLVT